jgi:hypothetical protein
MTITTTQLLDAVKRGVTVPSNQVRFSDADLLKFADEETESTIMPMLSSIRQEFLVKQKNVPVVANQAGYKIPYRAVGRNLRDIKLADTAGNVIRRLALVDPSESHIFALGTFGEPNGYMIQGDKVVLLPTPASAGYNIQFFYELAPSALVPVTSAGQISAIDTGTGIVTISASVAGFITAQTMDLVDGKAGCTVKSEDIVNSSVAGTAITFTAADLPSDLAVGDWVTASGETPVVQLPNELTQSLVQAVICRVLEALSDYEGLQAAKASLKEKMNAAEKLLTPRVQSQVPVVINRNGLLRRPLSRFRYRI